LVYLAQPPGKEAASIQPLFTPLLLIAKDIEESSVIGVRERKIAFGNSLSLKVQIEE
jgi:hypothetical protein